MKMKNEKKQYYTKLHTTGFKYTDRFCGFDSYCAHFSTDAEVNSPEWNEARQEAIEFFGAQQVQHGWNGWQTGKTFVKTHDEEITCMSPAYFEGHRSQPIFKEVK